MTELSRWLQEEMDRRHLTQSQVAVYAGVAQGTLSEVLRKGHIPRLATLFRLADYFEISRVEVLRLAGHLRTAEEMARRAEAPPLEGDPLEHRLLAEFRQLPDGWKEGAIAQVQTLARLARSLPQRRIGQDGERAPEVDVRDPFPPSAARRT